jgi:hypothetical protein
MWPVGRRLSLADPLPRRVQRDAHGLERPRGDALALVDQAEQDVLGADVVVVEHPRLFLGVDDHPSGPVRESLEHELRIGATGRLQPAPDSFLNQGVVNELPAFRGRNAGNAA